VVPTRDLVDDAVTTTTTAAIVLGVVDHRLQVGGNADPVVHHPTLRELLRHHAAPASVVGSGGSGGSGGLVASSTASTTFQLEGTQP
jgi:cytosine deaminase